MNAASGGEASDWGDEGRAETRRGLPAWALWGCGGGCVLMTLVLVGVALLFGRLWREATDPERVWAGVAELLPFDERPAGWEAFGLARSGLAFFVLRHGDEVLLVRRAHDREEVASLLDPSAPENTLHFQRLLDPEAGTIVLQEREAPVLWFRGGLADLPGSGGETRGSGIRIDVTGAGVPTVLDLVVAGDEGRIPEERVAAALAPFDVWRGR